MSLQTTRLCGCVCGHTCHNRTVVRSLCNFKRSLCPTSKINVAALWNTRRNTMEGGSFGWAQLWKSVFWLSSQTKHPSMITYMTCIPQVHVQIAPGSLSNTVPAIHPYLVRFCIWPLSNCGIYSMKKPPKPPERHFHLCVSSIGVSSYCCAD